MIKKLLYVNIAGITAILIGMTQPASAQTIAAPPVPPEIQVPAGYAAFMKGSATGTQNYICLPSGTGAAWKLFGPQATLFLTFKLFNVEVRQQIITHFLGSNPDENGMSRPTWQSSLDTSAVWGKARPPVTDTHYVAPGAIPWLLLDVVGSEPGPTGGNMMTPAKFIQRLNTSGGIMPSAGCVQSTDAGAVALVPYTADYYFYKADH